MNVVRFKDGTFAVRRSYRGAWQYLDCLSNGDWWYSFDDEEYFKHEKLEDAEERMKSYILEIEKPDYGEPV